MSESEARRRLTEVLAAFTDIPVQRDVLKLRGLHMRGTTSPPVTGFSVRLQPQQDGPGVELFVHPWGAQLSSWPARAERPAYGLGRELPLEVDLRADYRCGEQHFQDARGLTRTLLERMEDELREFPAEVERALAGPIPVQESR